MGSKTRIAKYIVPIIQDCIDKNKTNQYIELFVGGANVIDKIKSHEKIGNDNNRPLIHLLKYVQDDNELPEMILRDEYSKVRSKIQGNQRELFDDDWYVGCVGFLASYNGRFFDGGYAQAGYEKTKTGERYRDYYKEAKNNLIKQSQQSLFKDIIFCWNDYQEYIKICKPQNAVIYCDPPYQNTKQFANSKNFDYEKFWETMREVSRNNYVFISELNAPDDFECIWEKPVSRSIKATDKSEATEKLFTYKNKKYCDAKCCLSEEYIKYVKEKKANATTAKK